MLQARQLTCVREDRTLFESLSFDIAPGDVVQLEGPNGVGKTSLLRILAGLSQPHAGSVCWQGEEIHHCRDEYHANLLYLGHHAGVKTSLTPYENLSFYQRMHHPSGQRDLWEVLARVGLAGFEETPCGHLSAGQQRRVALARLWLCDEPRLWILDEPFTAIDRNGVRILESLFVSHADKGGMVLLTTHQEMALSPERLRRLSLSDGLRGAA